jgi:hypothetical protein
VGGSREGAHVPGGEVRRTPRFVAVGWGRGGRGYVPQVVSPPGSVEVDLTVTISAVMSGSLQLRTTAALLGIPRLDDAQITRFPCRP